MADLGSTRRRTPRRSKRRRQRSAPTPSCPSSPRHRHRRRCRRCRARRGCPLPACRSAVARAAQRRAPYLRVRSRPASYGTVVTMDDVRALATTLPRSSEAFVRGRVKFRIGRIVYLSFSRDGQVMGFAFPKELREALVESEPEKFAMPSESDLRYHWVHARLAAIDATEMRELVEDAWAFCVPKRVVEEYAAEQGYG